MAKGIASLMLGRDGLADQIARRLIGRVVAHNPATVIVQCRRENHDVAAARGDLGNTERTEHSDIRGTCCELQLYLSGRAFHPIEGKGLGPPDGAAIYQRPPDRSRRARPSVGEAHRCNVCRESASETCGCAGGNARKRERSPANEIAP